MKKIILSIIIIIFSTFVLCSCENFKKSDDIVILFTNDVHCGIDDYIGYAGLAAYKSEMQRSHNYVTLVDCGDFVQGDYSGAVSQGKYIIDLMNEVGYDYVIFGNHEFDYGMEELKNNVDNLDAKVLNCNFSYIGTDIDWVSTSTIPYEIKTYGDKSVAFIGVSTPFSLTTSTPTKFMVDGKYVYDFGIEDGEEYFYNLIQSNIDECKNAGADYVVVLSHLGVENAENLYTSLDLASKTTGIDVILDAHTHTVTSTLTAKSKDDKIVRIASTGTKLENIGKLVIGKDSSIEISLISDYGKKDIDLVDSIDNIKKSYEEVLNEVIGYTDIGLSCYDSEGIRMVRSREVAIGDFVADAYRLISGADIAMCNGGVIRASLDKGDITYNDIISINPYGNSLCVIEISGQEILDMLEYFYRYVKDDYKQNGVALGEDGSFQQVSGIKFTVDTKVEASIEINPDDSFVKAGSTRRVSDVMVLKDGEYVAIDPNATYTLASHNYMIKNGGCGMYYFLANHNLIIDESIADYQILIDYINLLNGDMSSYSNVDNRIIIK